MKNTFKIELNRADLRTLVWALQFAESQIKSQKSDREHGAAERAATLADIQIAREAISPATNMAGITKP